ncbi:MAG: hypothetical protein MUF54_09715 [Polyangiaceae bacterium]|nr:hypothetical protein [Polyangiaceae bacterium]
MRPIVSALTPPVKDAGSWAAGLAIASLMLAMGVFTVYEAWESSTHKPEVVSTPHRAQQFAEMGVAAASQPLLGSEATEEEREDQEDSTDDMPPASAATPQSQPPRMDRPEPRIGRVFSLGSPAVADGYHASDSRAEEQSTGRGEHVESREVEPEPPPQSEMLAPEELPVPEPPPPESVSREPPSQSEEPSTEDASSEQREPPSEEAKPERSPDED